MVGTHLPVILIAACKQWGTDNSMMLEAAQEGSGCEGEGGESSAVVGGGDGDGVIVGGGAAAVVVEKLTVDASMTVVPVAGAG